MRRLIVVLVILFSSVAAAEDRSEKIKRLMEVQGLIQTFEQQLALGRKQSDEQGRAMLDQMMASLTPSPEFTERFDQAFQSFMAEL
jgi:predicted secreted protein